MEYVLNFIGSGSFCLILMIALLFVLINLLCGVLSRTKRIYQIRKRTGNIILMYERQTMKCNPYLD